MYACETLYLSDLREYILQLLSTIKNRLPKELHFIADDYTTLPPLYPEEVSVK